MPFKLNFKYEGEDVERSVWSATEAVVLASILISRNYVFLSAKNLATSEILDIGRLRQIAERENKDVKIRTA